MACTSVPSIRGDGEPWRHASPRQRIHRLTKSHPSSPAGCESLHMPSRRRGEVLGKQRYRGAHERVGGVAVLVACACLLAVTCADPVYDGRIVSGSTPNSERGVELEVRISSAYVEMYATHTSLWSSMYRIDVFHKNLHTFRIYLTSFLFLLSHPSQIMCGL